MSAIRKDGIPANACGEESKVLSREQSNDDTEGWSIVARPYRHRVEDALIDNLGSESCCCLLPGNRVWMADGSRKPIESVRAGDEVMTMSGPAKVRSLESTVLGMTRKVIELRGQGDECLVMTDDHPLWVSRRSGGQSVESWGTYNLHHVMYEMRHTEGFELDRMPVALCFDLPEQVAHASGWLHVRPIFHHLPPQTQVFHLVVESACSFVAEGFPVFSHALHSQGPSGAWMGLGEDRAVEEFLRGLTIIA